MSKKPKKGHTIGDLRRILKSIEYREDNPPFGIVGAQKIYPDDLRTIVAALKNFLAYADRQPYVFTDDYIFAEAK